MKKIKRINIFLVMFCLVASFGSVFATNTSYDINKMGEGTDGIKVSADSVSISGINSEIEDTSGVSPWNTLFIKYREIIVAVSGVATLTFIIFFIINFVKLGQTAGNPQGRSQALMGIIWCGIAAAALGGVTIFAGFFYNMMGGAPA